MMWTKKRLKYFQGFDTEKEMPKNKEEHM